MAHSVFELQLAGGKAQGITGVEAQRIYVDGAYRGHDYTKAHCAFHSGQKRGVVNMVKKELRRRRVVEPVIEYLKSDGFFGRNYLKDHLGGQ